MGYLIKTKALVKLTFADLALTCKSEDVTLMVEAGVPGSVPTGG